MNVSKGISLRMLVGWFLILWGATFFFSGIWGLLDLASDSYLLGFAVIEVLWDLTDLAISGVLVIIGIKLLRGERFGL